MSAVLATKLDIPVTQKKLLTEQMMLIDTRAALGRTPAETLDEIIAGRYIDTVFQPIVSLAGGEVFGYEALSRISSVNHQMNIAQMFKTADEVSRSWELETLCRERALENAASMDSNTKIALNVNPNIIHDEEFRDGFTKKRLQKYKLDYHNVIFEITERVAIADRDAFLRSVAHYKDQNYMIAIDDVGAGYSGLSMIADVKPDLLKIDMSLIRSIDKDITKQLLCGALADFCKNAGIKSVAEGIETEEELETLSKLGIDFGQGFFIGIPRNSFEGIAQEKLEKINKYYIKKYSEHAKSSVYPIIGHLAKAGCKVSPDEKAEKIYEMLRLDPTITEFTVVENNTPIGFMTKTALNEVLGGRYGFSLHSRKSIRQVVKTSFLQVNFNMPVNEVSRLAMQRPFDKLYDPIVVVRDKEYSGIVTIKDLLDICTKVEVEIGIASNPLTGLPGNLLIEKEILSRVFGDSPYCVTYYDIDSFKAYNDAYGFQNGDMMLSLVADLLRKYASNGEFIGHIGGDDFIVIHDYVDVEKYCQDLLDDFSSQVRALYRDEDLKSGYIVSKNRNGVTDTFPIASLSIAGISNRAVAYNSIDDFSKAIAELKKKCKRQTGNYYEII